MCLTTVGLEVLLRIYHRKLFHLESMNPGRTGESGVDYHPRLGWIPKSGRFGTGWSWTTDESGLRSNGRPAPAINRPILTVGDSFTFGDEVEDSETWPAHLEGLLRERVLNAGVFAYGLDQACLRAEDLLDVYEPDVVIVAFISDDINRAEFSYYQAWKPYFEYVNDRLELRNVPVPRGHAPTRRLPTLNRALGYSFIANAILTRTDLAQWYSGPGVLKRHDHGESVAVDLLARLESLAKLRGGRLVAISLATNGRIGGNERIPRVVGRLRERGVPVLDLASEILRMHSDRLVRMFKRRGHYSPEMNAWVAERVAAFLQGTSAAADQHGGRRRASARRTRMGARMATAAKMVHAHIVKTPGVRGGKARIDGTRVCVVDLVFLLQRGFTPEQMRTHYSDRPLTLAEVHSALAYYYDNTEEIEAYVRASDEWEEEFEARKAEHLARRAGQ